MEFDMEIPQQKSTHCRHCGQRLAKQIDEFNGNRFGLYRNDFRDLKSIIGNNSIDAVITDPPYGSGGFLPKDTLKSSKSKYVSTGSSYETTLPDIDGDSLHPDEWRQLMIEFCMFTKRVLVDGGTFAMFIDWRNMPKLQAAIFQSGLIQRGCVVWDKGLGTRPMKNGFRNQSEYLLWGTKGATLSRDAPVYLPGVFKHSTITNGKVHITQKPIGLMKEIVEVCVPCGTIFDPFMGSGTTGVASLESGRKFIGCETVDQYFETAKRRCCEASQV